MSICSFCQPELIRERGESNVSFPPSTSQGSARRQRRIARRRHEILTAAAEIFAEKGYSATTTKEIADAADVAEGTLYNYFDGKRDILMSIASEAELLLQETLLKVGRLENRAAMTALVEKAFDISEAQLPFIRALMAEAWTDDGILQAFFAVRLKRVFELLQAFIAERVESGAFRSIDVALGARIAMGTFGALILPVLRGIEPLPPRHERHVLAETIVDFLLDGIRVRSE
jgi:AcrR family transcriptional regulator